MNEPTPARFGRVLRDARRARGLTQEQLAAALVAAGATTSQGSISRWERGHAVPDQQVLHVMTRILGIPVQALPMFSSVRTTLEERVAYLERAYIEQFDQVQRLVQRLAG